MSDVDDALRLVTVACRAYRGTADEHDQLAAALDVIKLELAPKDTNGDTG